MTDAPQDLIAAAARAVAHYGLRKTSLTDVAKEAGVSRATAYRAFGGRDQMLEAVGRHEVCRFLRHLEQGLANTRDPRTVIARALDESLQWMAHHPVVSRALDSEADLLVTLLAPRPGGQSLFVHVSRELAASFTRLGHASSFALPVEHTAEALVRTVFSCLLMPTSTFVSREQVLEALMHGLAGENSVSDYPRP